MILDLIEHLDEADFFMPPWAGTREEAKLLADYLRPIAPSGPRACCPSGPRRREVQRRSSPWNLFDASQLPPLPAPLWFVQFFKVLGFTLHMVPMNLWYAGLLGGHGALCLRQRARPAVRRPADASRCR